MRSDIGFQIISIFQIWSVFGFETTRILLLAVYGYKSFVSYQSNWFSGVLILKGDGFDRIPTYYFIRKNLTNTKSVFPKREG